MDLLQLLLIASVIEGVMFIFGLLAAGLGGYIDFVDGLKNNMWTAFMLLLGIVLIMGWAGYLILHILGG